MEPETDDYGRTHGMTHRLAALVDKYRNCEMTESEQAEQAVNFAFGNAHHGNSDVTKEGVARNSPPAKTDSDKNYQLHYI